MSEPGSNNSAGPNRDFQPIENPDEARQFLREGAKLVASAMLWTKNQEQVVNTHVSAYSETDQTLYFWKPKEFDPQKFIEGVNKSGVSDCFFSLSLARANLFFKAQLLGIDSGGIKFKVPERLFKVQRRKDLRYLIPDSHILRIEFKDPVFPDKTMTKRVLDLSAGGVSVLIGDAEEAIFTAGLILGGLTFTLNSRKISCDGEVRHVRKMPADGPHRGLKLGILFQKLRPGDQQIIASHVFEETRKYFSRFI